MAEVPITFQITVDFNGEKEVIGKAQVDGDGIVSGEITKPIPGLHSPERFSLGLDENLPLMEHKPSTFDRALLDRQLAVYDQMLKGKTPR